jgi:hypothetical protein
MLVPQIIDDSMSQIQAILWVGKSQVTRDPVDIKKAVTLKAGESYTYTVTIDDSDNSLYDSANPTTNSPWDFTYTGAVQHFVVPATGNYRLEVWGAQGGTIRGATGGAGGYAQGEIALTQGEILYIYVGESATSTAAAFNGGAAGTSSGRDGSGGGATDIRLVNGEWNDAPSLNSRILVAGGGGGGGYDVNGNRRGYGGAAGGLTGYNGTSNNGYTASGQAGTQTAGGAGVTSGSNKSQAGSFGKGSVSANGNVGSGGGGYYGGSGAARTSGQQAAGGGGGGSSFISGMTGCVAIDPSDITNNPRTQDTASSNTTALNYNTALFGASPTWNDGDEIILTTCSMIDGTGYQWNTGAKADTAGDMPDPSGGTMTGRTGNGYARITFL